MSSVSPCDLQQGAIGDCWLISSMASLAEYPDFVASIIKDNGGGQYTVTLYSFASGEMENIEVDDNFPYDDSWIFAYAQPSKEDEIWPSVLEKAFAKSAGGYKNLNGGLSTFAFGKMTGCTDLERISKTDGVWSAYSYSMTSDNPQDQDQEVMGDAEEDLDADSLMDKLAQYDSEKYLMCCGSNSGSDKEEDAGNIVQGHAFTILQVAKNPKGSEFNLIKIRNPWANTEWNGPWSDDDDMWTEHPDIAEELQFVAGDDGSFWMPIESFMEEYEDIFVCKHNMETASAGGGKCGACSVM